MAGRLQGKVAVITGAGTGVGRACMLIFAQEGARVVGAGRTQSTLDESLRLVKRAGGEGCVVRADVGDVDDAQRIIEAAVAAYGGVDILVNNAGVGYSYEPTHPKGMAALADTPPEYWRDVININLNSVYYTSRHAIPQMLKRGGGAIVNVSSIGGLQGMSDAHAYSAAKAGMINLTRSLAVTYGPRQIRSNCVAPGGIDTEMVRGRLEEVGNPYSDDATRFALCPLGRIGRAEEMAQACLFLASGEASYVNGAVLAVDGGSTAGIAMPPPPEDPAP